MARSSKTVSFSLPGSASGSRLSTPTRTPTKPADNDKISPAPDLVADIICRPNNEQPPDLEQSYETPPDSVDRPPSRPPSDHGKAGKPRKASASRSRSAVPSYVRLAHKACNSRDGRGKSPLFEHSDRGRFSKSTPGIAKSLREQSNHATHEHVRSVKQDVSRLREHLLKIEEEVKNMNRGRSTLELSVQDARRALSVNQQSISTQQKKSSKGEEDASVKLLREESRVLSRGKRSIEQHLQVVKTHLQVLDTTRRNLKSTTANLSSALDLDAQNLKVYDGPKSMRSDPRQRQYASAYQSKPPGEEAGKLLAVACEVVSNSKAIRAEIKTKILSVQTAKNEAHKKITDAISHNVQEARVKKRDMLIERGQVRLAQNSTLHRLHEEEIALGIALGPVSDKHRSVSEKVERPLSQMRPGSAAEERENFKQTKHSLTRQLSASSERASLVSHTDKKLSSQLREGSQSVFLDSQTLRVRKMSLDNRWVQ